MLDKMNVDEMESGREMDAVIAELVFGLETVPEPYGSYLVSSAGGNIPLEFYSTDIAAAWQVVERLGYNWTMTRDMGHCGNEYETKGDKMYRFILAAPGMPMWGIVAKTAPLAICRAALKAVMEATTC